MVGMAPATAEELDQTGPLLDDTSENSEYEHRDAADALQNRARGEIVLPIPFDSRSCETCLTNRKGDYSPQSKRCTAPSKGPPLWGTSTVLL